MSRRIHQGRLRQIQLSGTLSSSSYPILETEELLLGRSPDCQVILDFNVYSGVSRRHAVIRYSQEPQSSEWQLCDLGSANGTFLNGIQLDGCHPLKQGDRIALGKGGPEFIFEIAAQPSDFSAERNNIQSSDISAERKSVQDRETPPSQYRPTVPHGITPLITHETDLSLSQIIPILGHRQELTQKAYLIPGLGTVLLVVSLIVAAGIPALFNFLLALYLGCGGFYFIYRLCNRSKPWWVFFLCGLGTILLLMSPVADVLAILFRGILPGNIKSNSKDFIAQFVSHFFGAGLFEELLKILPVLFLLRWGQRVQSPLKQKIGVQEPADGIVLGAASALGFTLIETLGQYLPQVAKETATTLGLAAGELASLQILIIRILASISGHMAYSGYFGYFVGLSVLKPSKRWQILGVGYLTSALLHAFWNASALSFGPLALLIVGGLSYSFLISAILKAREFSERKTSR
jgi:RsiW-degrading membrane proteinase PrsW (M82 family)